MVEFGYFWLHVTETFPGGSAVKNLPPNAGEGSLTPWRRKWQRTTVSLLGKSHEQRNLAGYNPWHCKESDTTWQLKKNKQTKIQTPIKTGLYRK